MPLWNYIQPLECLSMKDVNSAGGKNASLGEMIQQLSSKGIRVPTGFAILCNAYNDFLAENDLVDKLEALFVDLNKHDLHTLRNSCHDARNLIMDGTLSMQLSDEISAAYLPYSDGLVAVRSSAIAEDSPEASFAGLQESFLNVRRLPDVLRAVKRCFASLFTDRAVMYRMDKGFSHKNVAISVGVQRMVRSDLACSGVMFTIDTETGFKNAILINSSYGVGESVVQGSVTPDEFVVFKPTLDTNNSIINKKIGSKETKIIYDAGGTKSIKSVPVPNYAREVASISDEDVISLARWGRTIEDHYSHRNDGKWTPMDIEWAKDGMTGELFVVQARPETVESRRSDMFLSKFKLKPDKRLEVMATGRAVGRMIGQGKVCVIDNPHYFGEFKEKSVLVTTKTDPDWEVIMKKASAIVTNVGGRTCHAAIIARELGIPAIVGCTNATWKLKNGQLVTVSCAEGEVGHVYNGAVPFEKTSVDLNALPRPKVDIKLNMSNPDEAFLLSSLPCEGVGLTRLEFIIANNIRIHPLALLYPEKVSSNDAETIRALTQHYANPIDLFIQQLSFGIAMIAAAFYPKHVIVRFSDFKTNEYANLIGGSAFEPKEENPMLGWRGASRYYHPSYAEGFALECAAMKRVREEMGLSNVVPMIPFCRTPEEGRRVLQEMEKNGLVRGRKGLQVYVMCELPSNVILAKEFASIFDGFSIGSNDLTQLVLGVDRDSSLVSNIFDERNEAVKKMIKIAIEAAREKDMPIGLCGQAPSDYPEFAHFLMDCGISSISLNADSFINTLKALGKGEKREE